MINMLKSKHFWTVWFPPHCWLLSGLIQGYATDSRAFWVTAALGYIFISGLGVAVGLHRYFSHKAFKTHPIWQQLMLYFGALACHGHALFWVALHVGVHHRHADTEKDLHSPNTKSLWQAYQGYAFDPEIVNKVPMRAGASFLRHPEWQWQVQWYKTVLWSTWALVAAIAWLSDTWGLFYGLAAAQVWAIHQEAIVNVLGHKSWFGAYRNYKDISDKSVNRPVLGLFTWGQALHNNHHGDAGNPNFGFKWWEFDPAMLWVEAIESFPEDGPPTNGTGTT